MSKRIPELDVGTVGIGSLFETAQVDGTSSTGYNSTKVSASDVGNFIANVLKYSDLDNKTIIQAILDAGGGGTANMTELTQAEYDALEQAGLLVEDMMYFITDGKSSSDPTDFIDDTTIAADKVWSSQKTDSEISAVASVVATKQDDLSCGQLSNVDLDDYKTNGFYWVSQTNVSNKPATNFGYLIVAHPSTVVQIFIAFANDSTISRGDMYVRFYANNQWYGWNKIASSRPEPVKATRTGLTIAASTTSYFTFSGIPVKTGYTRMVTCANPSEGGLYYLRTVENGNDLRIYVNNSTSASVTFDLTIMVEYIAT